MPQERARRVARAAQERYNPGRLLNLLNLGRCGSQTITSELRVGVGHDTHRLESGGPLRLGGVDVPCEQHAAGHSDADVLLHAVTDALLGAASLGDIGQWFPDTDPANRGRDSGEMLGLVCQRLAESHRIVNVDCIVFLEKPKLAEFKPAIRQRLAELLGIDQDRVGIKAKTGEGLGAIGAQQSIAAQCVALVERTG